MKSTQINVIQFGTGNFLRAFIEPVFQNLKNKGIAHPQICIVESTGSGKVKELSETDFQYALWITGVQNGEIVNTESKIDCVVKGLALPYDKEEFLSLAKNVSLEWVISNVTEAGFVLDNEKNESHFPKSFPARLALFLYTRYQFFAGDPSKGLQILPCELVAENGEKLHEMVVEQASRWNLNPDFMHWLSQSCSFYTSLVDRIVPGKPSTETLEIHHPESIPHPHRVQAEPYFLLAIQGKPKTELNLNIFEADFPVIKVESVEPFAIRKVRILNGSHIAMVVLGLPKGVETVSEFMEDQVLLLKLKSMIEEEVIPFIDQDHLELLNYSTQIWDRFRNPFVKHKLADISLNTIAKLSPRIIESIKVYFDSRGILPQILTNILVSAISNYVKFPEQIRDTPSVKDIFEEARALKSTEAQADFILTHQGLWNIDLCTFEGLKALLMERLS